VRPSSRLFPLRPGIGSVPAHLSVTSAPRCRAHHRHLCVPAFKLCVLHCRCRYRRQALTTMQTNLGHAFTLYPPFASTLELWKKKPVCRARLCNRGSATSSMSPYTHTCACRAAALWSCHAAALNRPRVVLFMYLLLAFATPNTTPPNARAYVHTRVQPRHRAAVCHALELAVVHTSQPSSHLSSPYTKP
jgi:hypothetical protein